MQYLTKETLVSRINDINTCENVGKRMRLLDNLTSVLYFMLKDSVGKITFQDGCIYVTYTNFDSNCGLSIVTESSELENLDTTGYIPGTDLRFFAKALSECADRNDDEWLDLITDDYYIVPDMDVQTVADMLLDTQYSCIGRSELEEFLKQR